MLVNIKREKEDKSMLSFGDGAIQRSNLANNNINNIQTNPNYLMKKEGINFKVRDKTTIDGMIIEMTNAINNYAKETELRIKQNKEVEDFKKFFFPGLEKILSHILKTVTAEKDRTEKIETIYKFYKGKSDYLKQFQTIINQKEESQLNLASNPNAFKKEVKEKEKLNIQPKYIFDKNKTSVIKEEKKEYEKSTLPSITTNMLPKKYIEKVVEKEDNKENNLTKSLNLYDRNRSNNKDNTRFNSTITTSNVNNESMSMNISVKSFRQTNINANKFGGSNKQLNNKLSSSLSNNKLKIVVEKPKRLSIKTSSSVKKLTKFKIEKPQEINIKDKEVPIPIIEEKESDIKNEQVVTQISRFEEVIPRKPKNILPIRIQFPEIKNLEKHKDKLFANQEKIINIKCKDFVVKPKKLKNQSKSLKPEIRSNTVFGGEISSLNENNASNCINVEVLTPSPSPSSEKGKKKKNQTSSNLAHIRDHNSEQENFLSQRRTLCEFRGKETHKKKGAINISTKSDRPEVVYYPKYFLPYEGYGLQARPSDTRERETEENKSFGKTKSKEFQRTKNNFLKTTMGLSKVDMGKLK